MDAVEAELQYMIAVEAGDTARAAGIRTAWEGQCAAHAERESRVGWRILATSAALWTVSLIIGVHLLTQLVP